MLLYESGEDLDIFVPRREKQRVLATLTTLYDYQFTGTPETTNESDDEDEDIEVIIQDDLEIQEEIEDVDVVEPATPEIDGNDHEEGNLEAIPV